MSAASGDGLLAWLSRPVLEVAPSLLGALLTTRGPDGEVTLRLTEVEAYDGERDPGSHAFRGRSARNAVMYGPAGHLYVYRHLGLHHCVNVVTGAEGVAAAVLLRAGEVVDGVEVARRRRAAAGVTRSDADLARGPARLTVALGIDHGWNGAVLHGPDDPEPHPHLLVGGAPSAAGDAGPHPHPHPLAGTAPPGAGDAGPYPDPLTGDAPTRSGHAGRHPAAGFAVLRPGAPVPPASIRTGPRVGVSGVGGSAEHHPWRFWLAGEPTVSAYRAAGPRARRTRPAPGTAH